MNLDLPTPQPYYEDEYVTLFHGDCFDQRLSAVWTRADVLLTDPPYGRGWSQGASTRKNGGGLVAYDDGHDGIEGDHNTDARDLAVTLWALACWPPRRPAAMFGDLTLPPPRGTRQVLIYHKAMDAGTKGALGGFRRDVEGIYLIGPWQAGLGGSSSVLSSGRRNVGGLGGLTYIYGHPHAKPVDVLAAVLSHAELGSVADPFAGSGSTLVAAKAAGRRAIGVEIEERYCERAALRLSQGMLFHDVTHKNGE